MNEFIEILANLSREVFYGIYGITGLHSFSDFYDAISWLPSRITKKSFESAILDKVTLNQNSGNTTTALTKAILTTPTSVPVSKCINHIWNINIDQFK